MKKYVLTALFCLALPALLYAEGEGSLRGSRSSMVRQNAVARKLDYTFLRTADQIEDFVAKGLLVRIDGNDDYEIANVSYPYVRPEVELFVRRLSRQHRAACGEKLVVTSATRPLSKQPRNAHPLSVHPAGMAVDLRVSSNRECREWLADALLSLEAKSLLDVTREYRPPHFHVAVFPEAYAAYAAPLEREDSLRLALEAARAARPIATLTSATLPTARASQHTDVDWSPFIVASAAVAWGIRFALSRRKRESNDAD